MERIKGRVVYQNPWLSVREDQIRYADGSLGVYGVVDKPDYAVVLPRTADGFWLVEQFRYPIGRRVWEFPQGGWPINTADTAHRADPASATRGPVELAHAELAEETGLRAGTMTALGRVHGASGFCSQAADVFLALELTPGEPDREISEQDMVHAHVSDSELTALIRAGDFVDAVSLAALTLYRLHLDAAGPQ